MKEHKILSEDLLKKTYDDCGSSHDVHFIFTTIFTHIYLQKSVPRSTHVRPAQAATTEGEGWTGEQTDDREVIPICLSSYQVISLAVTSSFNVLIFFTSFYVLSNTMYHCLDMYQNT